jgi:hypothetical protein
MLNDYGIEAYLMATNAVRQKDILASAVSNAKISDGTIGLGGAADGSTAGKLNAKDQRFTTAASNTIVTVPSGLSRAPVGYDVIRCNKDAVVYDGSTAFTTSNLYIKATRQSAIVTLRIF